MTKFKLNALFLKFLMLKALLWKCESSQFSTQIIFNFKLSLNVIIVDEHYSIQ